MMIVIMKEYIAELELTLKDDIHYYNHDRIKVKLKGLSPGTDRTQSVKIV